MIGELGWAQSLSPSLRNAWGHVKSETWANFNVKLFNFFQVGQNRTSSFIQLKISFGSTEEQQQKPQAIWQDYPVAFIATAAGSASAWSLFCKAASASSIITLSAITEDIHSNWSTLVFFSENWKILPKDSKHVDNRHGASSANLMITLLVLTLSSCLKLEILGVFSFSLFSQFSAKC